MVEWNLMFVSMHILPTSIPSEVSQNGQRLTLLFSREPAFIGIFEKWPTQIRPIIKFNFEGCG